MRTTCLLIRELYATTPRVCRVVVQRFVETELLAMLWMSRTGLTSDWSGMTRSASYKRSLFTAAIFGDPSLPSSTGNPLLSAIIITIMQRLTRLVSVIRMTNRRRY